MTTPILIDTDLGTDPDDLVALLTAAASPEVDLVGLTTCYGDTANRAELAADVMAALGRAVPIGAGLTSTLSGAEVWYAGNERHHAPAAPRGGWADAVELIVETARARPGLELVAVGPLTNIAAALEAEPRLPELVGGLAIMGGNFGSPAETEHNFRSDDVATRRVLESGLPVRAIGIEQTLRVPIPRAELEAWAVGVPLAERLLVDAAWWMDYHGDEWIFVHDPLTVLMVARPELFAWSRVSVRVGTEAALTVAPSATSRTEIVADVDVERAREMIVDRVRTALLASA